MARQTTSRLATRRRLTLGAARHACYSKGNVVSEPDPEAPEPAEAPGASDAKSELERAASARKSELAERPDEPPVVARMIVEIRSDGTRTIARGAIEEATTGERVAIEAHGSTPMALAASLAKSMLSAPMLAKQAVRALLTSRKGGKGSDEDKER
jgi:hypothetical protein